MEDFTIVFEKLGEVVVETSDALEEISQAELADIDALRRLSLEIQEPPALSYTTT